MLDDTPDTTGSASADTPGPFLRQPARFDILSRRVPALARVGAPRREAEAIAEITRRLGALNAAVGDFRAGLELLRLADTRDGFSRNWGPIACRDAGAALLDFHQSLKHMQEALKACPSLKRADKGLRAAQRRFAEAFPLARGKANGNRKPAGEEDAPASRPPLPRRHNDMGDAAILAGITREGARVAHVDDGKAIRFELSQDTLWLMVTLRDAVFGAFDSAG